MLEAKIRNEHGLGPLGGVFAGVFKSSHMRRVDVGGGALWRGDGGAPAPYSFSTQHYSVKAA